MSRLHAKLSPSSSHRWMSCPGSIRLIETLPERERSRSSRYAEEGTAAHRVAEECIRRGIPAEELLGYRVGISEELGPELYPSRGDDLREHEYEVTVEMVDAVNVYLSEIASQRARLPFGEEGIETRVQPLADEPEVFGHLDYSIIDRVEGDLIVNDFKYGAGVRVEVVENPQISIYALGRLRDVGPDNVSRVELAVTQPRAGGEEHGVRRWEVKPSDLVRWGEEVLRPAVVATRAADAPQVAGEWCRFCPASAICPALRRRVIEETRHDFDVPAVFEAEAPTLHVPSNPDDIARVLRAAPVIDAYLREVEGYAQRMLERGEHVPGFKLVRKRANRQWRIEEGDLVKQAAARGVKKSQLFESKLVSPAKAEKIKALGKDFVAEHAYKPEGGLTLTTEDDVRPAVAAPAISDFDVVSGELPATAAGGDLELFG